MMNLSSTWYGNMGIPSCFITEMHTDYDGLSLSTAYVFMHIDWGAPCVKWETFHLSEYEIAIEVFTMELS